MVRQQSSVGWVMLDHWSPERKFNTMVKNNAPTITVHQTPLFLLMLMFVLFFFLYFYSSPSSSPSSSSPSSASPSLSSSLSSSRSSSSTSSHYLPSSSVVAKR